MRLAARLPRTTRHIPPTVRGPLGTQAAHHAIFPRLGQLVEGLLRNVFLLILVFAPATSRAEERPAERAVAASLFEETVAPILERRCLSCHNPQDPKGGLSLADRESALRGGDSGEVIFAGDVESSYLVEMITPRDGRADMPKGADPLSEEEVAALGRWIAEGVHWPASRVLENARVSDTDWWSLQPLVRPDIPEVASAYASWVETPVDAFLLEKLLEHGLTPSPPVDRATLIRRLYFDLIGLPPSPEEIRRFVEDADPLAYERLVDRLLESPHYGERWARHWLDVVHYGDTHGYDKDKLRPHAWPYRDYVIRAFNADKPYGQFIRQQLAGDVLEPENPEGIVATGFIAAGPWDFIGHVEVPETKLDGQIARSLDRDDMVRTTMETFNSVTVGCARCHHHKFDPVTQQDYYSLQAVFAAVDRADRLYEPNPEVGRRRRALLEHRERLVEARQRLHDVVTARVGPELAELDQRLTRLEQATSAGEQPEFGYHSQIELDQDQEKWVQIDLGKSLPISKIVYFACHDSFNGIGAGFGFPVRYRIEVSDDPEFLRDVQVVVDHTQADVPNPGITPQAAVIPEVTARYVRFTATKLALRQNDYILALAELMVFGGAGINHAAGATVTALDSIEAPPRWRKENLVDGYYHGMELEPADPEQREPLRSDREKLFLSALNDSQRLELVELETELSEVESHLEELPGQQRVFAAGTDFEPQGQFQPRHGKPREIRVLHRGNITETGDVARPGVLSAIGQVPNRFPLADDHSEGERRAALAEWLTDPNHPLTWRSMANRVWLYHFGRGIVDSPNDFGRMGQLPTHPELLDWLACELRDGRQSLKSLHRIICRSAAYRQSSAERPECAESDGGNQWYWRMNRRRLEAEAIHDAVLSIAGKLDRTQFGPGFQDFVIEKPEHSPHYKYDQHDPDDPRSHRRSVYRFIVRSQQQPFMTTLDCADPSMQVDKRNETVTALQALALLNNRFMLTMSRHFADRIEQEADELSARVERAFELALGRVPESAEREALVAYAEQHGLANLCRVVLNLNEFIFVD